MTEHAHMPLIREETESCHKDDKQRETIQMMCFVDSGGKLWLDYQSFNPWLLHSGLPRWP